MVCNMEEVQVFMQQRVEYTTDWCRLCSYPYPRTGVLVGNIFGCAECWLAITDPTSRCGEVGESQQSVKLPP